MILRFSELPKSIQSIFPGVEKRYPDFRCYVRTIKGEERYFVRFNGETTRFLFRDGRWTADKTW